MTTERVTKDLYDLDSDWSDEQIAVIEQCRKFVDKEILPTINEDHNEERLPENIIAKLAQLGILEMLAEGTLDPTTYGLVCREIERGSSALRSVVSVQGSLVIGCIRDNASEEQKAEWLPKLGTFEAIGCFGLTEPDSGSDPASMRTHAKQDAGGDWVLNGTKMWITNGSIADVAVVWARTDDGVRGFVVPTDTPGFSANDIHLKASLRASVTSELVLDDVRLPADAVLPGVAGMRGPLSCLNEARFGILFGAIGAGRACYEAALDYAKERVQFGRPIASFQLTQRKLVEMMVAVQRGTLLAVHLGRLKDEGRLTSAQVSFGKLDNVRQALEIAREARSVLGANGITLEYPVIRHMNNLESVYTYEGTNEIHTLVLGQAITGHGAFS